MEYEFDTKKWKILLNYAEEITISSNYRFNLSLETERQIYADSERTRSNLFTIEEKQAIAYLLSAYCRLEEVNYKQGMNELLAPFLYLMRTGLTQSEVYTFFQLFIKKQLPTMFKDSTFRPLQCIYAIFKLLLRYHCPRIAKILEENDVIPSVYSTSWFITIFSSKTTSIPAVFALWEEILKEQDYLFPCFVAIAIIDNIKQELLSANPNFLPKILLELRFNTPEEACSAVEKARIIKANMPYALYANLMRYDVFKLDTVDSILNTLNMKMCLTIPARDIIRRTFPDIQLCDCPVENCKCSSAINNVPFIVIDCRPADDQQEGSLPNSDLLNSEAYMDVEFLKNVPNLYTQYKGVFHIFLMGSSEFVAREDYGELDSDNDEDYVQNMLENLLKLFMEFDFPYVSLVEGGFQKIHEFAMHYKIDIPNHSPSHCGFCNPNGSKDVFLIKDLKKIGNKIAGRFKAFSLAVKNIVRSGSNNLQVEETKTERRKSISKKTTM